MTPPESRVRRGLKWAGLGATVALGLLWVTMLYHGFGYQGTSVRVLVKCGYVNVYRGPNRLPRTWNHDRLIPYFSSKMVWPQLSTGRVGSTMSFNLTIPLLYPLVLAGIPTAILWRRQHRVNGRPCPKCGYNLTGNVSGICPECGGRASTNFVRIDSKSI